eukprot:11167707-Lingulodinium_polyedra.AAC.1
MDAIAVRRTQETKGARGDEVGEVIVVVKRRQNVCNGGVGVKECQETLGDLAPVAPTPREGAGLAVQCESVGLHGGTA